MLETEMERKTRQERIRMWLDAQKPKKTSDGSKIKTSAKLCKDSLQLCEDYNIMTEGKSLDDAETASMSISDVVSDIESRCSTETSNSSVAEETQCPKTFAKMTPVPLWLNSSPSDRAKHEMAYNAKYFNEERNPSTNIVHPANEQKLAWPSSTSTITAVQCVSSASNMTSPPMGNVMRENMYYDPFFYYFNFNYVPPVHTMYNAPIGPTMCPSQQYQQNYYPTANSACSAPMPLPATNPYQGNTAHHSAFVNPTNYAGYSVDTNQCNAGASTSYQGANQQHQSIPAMYGDTKQSLHSGENHRINREVDSTMVNAHEMSASREQNTSAAAIDMHWQTNVENGKQTGDDNKEATANREQIVSISLNDGKELGNFVLATADDEGKDLAAHGENLEQSASSESSNTTPLSSQSTANVDQMFFGKDFIKDLMESACFTSLLEAHPILGGEEKQ